MAKRTKLPQEAETEVLLNSRRKCCLCYYLDDDDSPKAGQIAHLDQNRENNDPENLAYLCLKHHDQYDSTTSQSKGLTINEVKAHRNNLYTHLVSQDAVVTGGNAKAKVDALNEIVGHYKELLRSVIGGSSSGEDAKQRAETEYRDFEKLVTENHYRKFVMARCVVVTTVIPENPAKEIYVRPEHDVEHGLALIGGRSGVVKDVLDSCISFIPAEDRPRLLTELTKTGTIRAVGNLRPLSEGDQQMSVGFNCAEFEQMVQRAIWTHVSFLKRIGVKGPWFVGYSAMKLANTHYVASGQFHFPGDNQNRTESVQPDLVAVPADVDISKPDEVAEIMKKPLLRMWRAYLPGKPILDANGSWTGYEPGPL